MSGSGKRGQRSLTVLSWQRGFDPGTWGGEAGHAPTGRHEPSLQLSLLMCRPTPKHKGWHGGGQEIHYITDIKITRQHLHLAASILLQVVTWQDTKIVHQSDFIRGETFYYLILSLVFLWCNRHVNNDTRVQVVSLGMDHVLNAVSETLPTVVSSHEETPLEHCIDMKVEN